MNLEVVVCVAVLLTLTKQSVQEPSNTKQGSQRNVTTVHDHSSEDTVRAREFFKKLKHHAFRKDQIKTSNETLGTQQDFKSESFLRTQSDAENRSSNNSSTNQVLQYDQREQIIQHTNVVQKEEETQGQANKEEQIIADSANKHVKQSSQTDNSKKKHARVTSSGINSRQMTTNHTQSNSKAESVKSKQYPQPEPTSDKTKQGLPKSRYFRMPSDSYGRRQYSKPSKFGVPGQPVQTRKPETNKETDNSLTTSKKVDSQTTSRVTDSNGINNTKVPIEPNQQSQPQRPEQTVSSSHPQSTKTQKINKPRNTGIPGHPVQRRKQKTDEEPKVSTTTTDNTSKVIDIQKSTNNSESTTTISNAKRYKEFNTQDQIRHEQTTPLQHTESPDQPQIHKLIKIGAPGQPVVQPDHQQSKISTINTADNSSKVINNQKSTDNTESTTPISNRMGQKEFIKRDQLPLQEQTIPLQHPESPDEPQITQLGQIGVPGQPVRQPDHQEPKVSTNTTDNTPKVIHNQKSTDTTASITAISNTKAHKEFNKQKQLQRHEQTTLLQYSESTDEPQTTKFSEIGVPGHPVRQPDHQEPRVLTTSKVIDTQKSTQNTESTTTIGHKEFNKQEQLKRHEQITPLQHPESPDEPQITKFYQKGVPGQPVRQLDHQEPKVSTITTDNTSKVIDNQKSTQNTETSTISNNSLQKLAEPEQTYTQQENEEHADKTLKSSQPEHSELSGHANKVNPYEHSFEPVQQSADDETITTFDTASETKNYLSASDVSDSYSTTEINNKKYSDQNELNQGPKLKLTSQQPLPLDQQNLDEETKNTSDTILQIDNNKKSTGNTNSDTAIESTYEQPTWSDEPDENDQPRHLYEKSPTNQQNSDTTILKNASETESKQYNSEDTYKNTTEQSQIFDQQYLEQDTTSSENTHTFETTDKNVIELNSKSEYYQATTSRTDLINSREESEAPEQTNIHEPQQPDETNTVRQKHMYEESNQSDPDQSSPQEQPNIGDELQTPSFSPENPSDIDSNDNDTTSNSYNEEHTTSELNQQEIPEKAKHESTQSKNLRQQESLDKSTQSDKSYQSEKKYQEHNKTDIEHKTNKTESAAATETRNSNQVRKHDELSTVSQQTGPEKAYDTYIETAGTKSAQSQIGSTSSRNTEFLESKETKGRDVQQTTSVFQQAIQTDLHLKTLIVEDGPQSGLCYCSCDNNNKPVFISVDPRSIPGFH